MAFNRGDRVRRVDTGALGSVTGIEAGPVVLLDGAKFPEAIDPQILVLED